MRRLTGFIAGVAVLALALSACGSGDSATTGGGGGTSALKGTGTGDTCKITTPIPIGAVFSLTGAAASYGESQKKGLELATDAVSYTHLRAHETVLDLVCRLLLEKKKK